MVANPRPPSIDADGDSELIGTHRAGRIAVDFYPGARLVDCGSSDELECPFTRSDSDDVDRSRLCDRNERALRKRHADGQLE